MKLQNDWRIWVWVASIVLSLLAIGININTKGVMVTYVHKDSPLYGIIKPGYIIREINGIEATPDLINNITGSLEIRTNHGTFYADANGTLGIEAKKVPLTRLKFGLDLEGGTRAIIKVKAEPSREVLDQTIAILQARINTYGLKEVNFRPIYGENFIEMEMAGGSMQEIKDLLSKQGKFEAYIPINISLQDGKGRFMLDDKVWAFDKGLINGSNESIDGIPFRVLNWSDSRAEVEFLVFTGSDIRTIYTDPQRSGIRRSPSGYSWSFQVLLDSSAAQRFARITRNLDVVGQSLSSPIVFYLDGNKMDELRISSSLKGRAETQPLITGGGATLEEARENMKNLMTLLRSGALPAPIEIVSVDKVSPKLGQKFLAEAVKAAVAAIVLVSLLVFIYYRDIVVVIPIIVSSFSETLAVLGTASIIGWTIDLPSIAGLLTALGASIVDQIMVVDETESGEEDIRDRIKKALFIIFGSAGISAASMIPLFFAGFGMLRGYAITTLLGIAISNFISRPAFNRILEYIKHGKPGDKEDTDFITAFMGITMALATFAFLLSGRPQMWLVWLWLIGVFIWFGLMFLRIYSRKSEDYKVE